MAVATRTPVLRVAIVLLAACCWLASAQAHRTASGPRGRVLVQAVSQAVSVAKAAEGGTAVSDVRAGAESSGKPTIAVAQGASIAQAGETVITQCEVYARDSVQYKECVGRPVGQKSNTSADVASASREGVVSWEAARTCASSPSNTSVPNSSTNTTRLPSTNTSVPDSQGRLWGFQNGSSCAFKYPGGSPVYLSNLTSTAPSPASGEAAAQAKTAAISAATAKGAAGNVTGTPGGGAVINKTSAASTAAPTAAPTSSPTSGPTPAPTSSPTSAPQPAGATAHAKSNGKRRT